MVITVGCKQKNLHKTEDSQATAHTYVQPAGQPSAGQYTGNTGIPRYEINTGSIIEIPKYRNSS